jgi:hypothetical protein
MRGRYLLVVVVLSVALIAGTMMRTGAPVSLGEAASTVVLVAVMWFVILWIKEALAQRNRRPR